LQLFSSGFVDSKIRAINTRKASWDLGRYGLGRLCDKPSNHSTTHEFGISYATGVRPLPEPHGSSPRPATPAAISFSVPVQDRRLRTLSVHAGRAGRPPLKRYEAPSSIVMSKEPMSSYGHSTGTRTSCCPESWLRIASVRCVASSEKHHANTTPSRFCRI
jgi:hypothetical protein